MQAIESPPLTFNDEVQMAFVQLLFSQMVVEKLVQDQRVDFPRTLASLSYENITAICYIIRRPGGLVSRRMPDRENEIFVLLAKNAHCINVQDAPSLVTLIMSPAEEC